MTQNCTSGINCHVTLIASMRMLQSGSACHHCFIVECVMCTTVAGQQILCLSTSYPATTGTLLFAGAAQKACARRAASAESTHVCRTSHAAVRRCCLQGPRAACCQHWEKKCLLTPSPFHKHARLCSQVLPAKLSRSVLPAPASGGGSVELLAIAGPGGGAESPSQNPPRMMLLEAAPAPSSQALLAHP